MSFAVIQTGGKQYKVSASEILKIERLNDAEGKTVEFKNVLFLNDDKTSEIGNPNIQGAKVEATILKNTKNKTVLVFKKKRRKNSRKKYGHRQLISLIKITKIFAKNGKLIAQAEAKKDKTLIKTTKIQDDSTRMLKAEQTRKLQEKEPQKDKTLIKTTKIQDDSTRMLKAEQTRKLQEKEAKKINEEEKQRLKEAQDRIKLKTKKSSSIKKKTVTKKKPLTTKKK